MSFNRWINVVLMILVVIWGALSVDAARTLPGPSATPLPKSENTSVHNSPNTVASTASPTPLQSVHIENTPKPTSSAEAVVRNLFAKLDSAATPTPAPTATPTVTPSPSSTPTSTPTPIAQISYKIQGGGVFYEGTLDTTGISVGEATKRIAMQHGFAFKYDATPLGWFVTEIAGLKQNPAQDKYWLYWVNGVFGDVSSDKKILQPGDTLIWQYGS